MSKGIPEKIKKYWNKIDVPQKHEIFVALNNHLSLIVIEPNLKNKVKNPTVLPSYKNSFRWLISPQFSKCTNINSRSSSRICTKLH